MASTHEYRVGKRRMAQHLHLPTTTTVGQIKKAWLDAGLEWPEGGPAGFYERNIDHDSGRIVVQPA